MAVDAETAVRSWLRAPALQPWLNRLRVCRRFAVDRYYRRRQFRLWDDYWKWRGHRQALTPSLLPPGAAARRALIVAKGTAHGAQIEMAFVKALELAGFETAVLCDRSFDKFFKIAGVRRFVRWSDHVPPDTIAAATALIANVRTVDDVLRIEAGGARVGKFAASTTFRALRVGRLDLSSATTRAALTSQLASGLTRAATARVLLEQWRPELALFMGNRYTGQSELMDISINHGVDVLTWFDAHRSSSLMLKRYRHANRDRHHGSISDESWDKLRAMEWTPRHQAELNGELHDGYATGDWYSRGGTQTHKTIHGRNVLSERLRLDPSRKTAVIFPHIVWDATLFWGDDLFSNYEDWLVETVRAACRNPRVNWIVKIHPAHVAKSAMERYDGEAAEITAIRERVGPLPPHVVVVPPDTDINTFSLFDVMDYCLTVRGTIGVEAAALGKRVLTAGSGRYDRRGFTTDSDSPEEYLHRLAHIQELPPPSPHEVDLARRFAYGAFVARPLPLSAWSITHHQDVEATTTVACRVSDSDALRRSPDIVAFAKWAADRSQEDFLWPGRVPEMELVPG